MQAFWRQPIIDWGIDAREELSTSSTSELTVATKIQQQCIEFKKGLKAMNGFWVGQPFFGYIWL